MKCPKCKTTELNKPKYHSPYFCKSCGGMWHSDDSNLDLSEIKIEDLGENHAQKEHESKTGICPSGHGIMIRAKVEIDEPFYLEKCTACGGIWFDKGKWSRIAEHNLADNLSITWSKSWQKKQSRKRIEKASCKQIAIFWVRTYLTL